MGLGSMHRCGMSTADSRGPPGPAPRTNLQQRRGRFLREGSWRTTPSKIAIANAIVNGTVHVKLKIFIVSVAVNVNVDIYLWHGGAQSTRARHGHAVLCPRPCVQCILVCWHARDFVWGFLDDRTSQKLERGSVCAAPCGYARVPGAHQIIFPVVLYTLRHAQLG